MVRVSRSSIALGTLAVCLATGMTAHAAEDSLADKLKARTNSELATSAENQTAGTAGTAAATAAGAQAVTGQAQTPNGAATNALQKLTGKESTGLTSSGSKASGLGAAGAGAGLLGGALGGSASSALGASALSGLGLPSIASGSAGNVAGVLEYCVKNNYLKKANVSTIKDSLLSKAGLGKAEPEKDTFYASGLSGILSGGDGKSFNLGGIQDNIKEKACDYVLDNAASLL